MAASDYEFDTDPWWASYLAEQMGANFKRLWDLKSCRDGTRQMPEYATGQSMVNYPNILRISRLNFGDQIVSALSARNRPLGFRTASREDDTGDPIAASIWRRSHMGTQFSTLNTTKNTYGEGFLTVIESDKDGEGQYPMFVVTTPWQTNVYVDPMRPWIVQAAITVGYNPITDMDTIMLMRPGKTPDAKAYYREYTRPAEGRSGIPMDGNLWTPSLDEYDEGPVKPYRNITQVPVSKFSTEDGFGIFEKHIDTLDRINHTILQRVVITVMQAFRQRAIDGDFDEVYPEDHERAGEKIDWQELFKAGPDALWFLPKDAKMWESAMADIRPIIAAIESDLKHLAAATSTPLYVLSPEAANGSAQGASLARETHTLKAEALRQRDADSLGRALAIAFEAMGDAERAVEESITVIWENTAMVSLAERALAAKDAYQSGASQQMVNEKFLGLTPDEMERERLAKDDESFSQGVAQAAPARSTGVSAAPRTVTPAPPSPQTVAADESL